jgi:hypothetical protein
LRLAFYLVKQKDYQSATRLLALCGSLFLHVSTCAREKDDSYDNMARSKIAGLRCTLRDACN